MFPFFEGARRRIAAALTCLAAVLCGIPAEAAIVISSGPTQNMNCSGGVCSASAADAVFNVNDLTAMLASMDVTIVAGSLSRDIRVANAVDWTSAHQLGLDAYRSIAFGQTIAVSGPGGLNITANHGGSGGDFRFEQGAYVGFSDLSSRLAIDGHRYKLVGDISSLAAAIAAKPGRNYALARSYDASAEGTYSRVPIGIDFSGRFEGLGNSISNLSIYDTDDASVGLFKAFTESAVVRDLRLLNANILAENPFFQELGALVGYNGGKIIQCGATGSVRNDVWTVAGGLVGESYGLISRSYADVEVSGAEDSAVGGLAGNAHGRVHNSYALGNVIAGEKSDVGGLIGYNWSELKDGYSTGTVSGGQSARVGGSMGSNYGSATHVYWDTETSRSSTGIAFQSGTGTVSGVTTGQLQSVLLRGFHPTIWGQSPGVNNGFPYLPGAPPN